MKRLGILGFALGVWVLSSCGVSYSKLRKVNYGATKQEVLGVLGEPRERTFQNKTEKWLYRTQMDATLWELVFEDGKVVASREYSSPRPVVKVIEVQKGKDERDDQVSSHTRPPSQPYLRPSVLVGDRVIVGDREDAEDREFRDFVARFDRLHWEEEQYAMLRDAVVSRRRFTCPQVVTLLKKFDWENEQMKALEILAPNIVLRGDLYLITDLFTWSSQKEQVRRILKEATMPRARENYGLYSEQDLEDRFQAFIVRFDRLHWDSDRKEMLKEAVAARSVFTCKQVATILKRFHWRSEQMEMLKILAPSILLRGDLYYITDLYHWDSEKKEVRDIVLGKGRK